MTGAKTGKALHFHCRVCGRDVAMKAQESLVDLSVLMELIQGCHLPGSHGLTNSQQVDGAHGVVR